MEEGDLEGGQRIIKGKKKPSWARKDWCIPISADKDKGRHTGSDIKREKQKNNVPGEEREAAGKSAEERERGRDREGGQKRKAKREIRENIFKQVMCAVIVFSLSLSLSPSLCLSLSVSLSLCLALNGRDVACICRQEGTQFGTIYSAVSALMHLRDRE